MCVCVCVCMYAYNEQRNKCTYRTNNNTTIKYTNFTISQVSINFKISNKLNFYF